MKTNTIIPTLLLMLSVFPLSAQYLGVNVTNPIRPVEVEQPFYTYFRLNSTDALNGTSGVEFLRTGAVNGEDWRIRNSNGDFRLESSSDNFNSTELIWRFTPEGYRGIHMAIPQVMLHLGNGPNATMVDPGAFLIGNHGEQDLTMDNNTIMTRNGADPSVLHFQNNSGKTTISRNEGYVGIGAFNPQTVLHLEGGEEASNTGDGLLLLGPKDLSNIVFDQNEILARNNGNPAALLIQPHGGDTRIGQNGGDLRIGATSGDGKVSVTSDGHQLYLVNSASGSNDWYLGASNANWLAGANHFLIGPTSGSANAILRLTDVIDNNGVNAPLSVLSNDANHQLLFDGNEIDALTSLYINHNSNENTLINSTGGKVGIGTSSPDEAILHVTTSTIPTLTLENEGWWEWIIGSYSDKSLRFTRSTLPYFLAEVDKFTGIWLSASDRRLKENIQALPELSPKVEQLKFHTYAYRHDKQGRSYFGVLAQELLEVFPHLVTETDENYLVNYDQLSVIALKVFQEQEVVIESLLERIEALE